MWTEFFVLLQPLPGENFRRANVKNTPAVQDSRSEDTDDALDNGFC